MTFCQSCRVTLSTRTVLIKRSHFPGLFASANDLKTEWVVVKGIKDYADGNPSSYEQTGTFACVMAASVVANIE